MEYFQVSPDPGDVEVLEGDTHQWDVGLGLRERIRKVFHKESQCCGSEIEWQDYS